MDVLKFSVTIASDVYPELYAELLKIESGRRRASRLKLLASYSLKNTPMPQDNKVKTSVFQKAFGQSIANLNK